MKLMTTIAVNGLFYGNEQSSAYGDITVSIFGSLLSMPPTLLKAIFQRYRLKNNIDYQIDKQIENIKKQLNKQKSQQTTTQNTQKTSNVELININNNNSNITNQLLTQTHAYPETQKSNNTNTNTNSDGEITYIELILNLDVMPNINEEETLLQQEDELNHTNNDNNTMEINGKDMESFFLNLIGFESCQCKITINIESLLLVC